MDRKMLFVSGNFLNFQLLHLQFREERVCLNVCFEKKKEKEDNVKRRKKRRNLKRNEMKGKKHHCSERDN